MIIRAAEKDLGEGFKIRRSLPVAGRRSVGPFVFWDHMGPVELKTGKEMIVRSHPHIGLSTLTYLFSGAILHRDSLGNELEILPGEVNWMTAGKGIVHSERSQGEGELEGIQLWVALPQEAEEVAPAFDHYKPHELPEVRLGSSDWILIAGEFQSKRSPVRVHSEMYYLAGHLKEGTEEVVPAIAGCETAAYVVTGSVSAKGETLRSGDMVVADLNESLALQAQESSRVMIFGGRPFPEKRHIWWNFVSSEKEKIEAAKEMWTNQKFPPVVNETEFIPLPD